jgi:hypothetical protein
MDRSRRLLTALALCGAATIGAPHLQPDAAGAATTASAVVRPGAFCKASEAGRVDVTADGRWMRCETTPTDARHRWRPVVK